MDHCQDKEMEKLDENDIEGVINRSLFNDYSSSSDEETSDIKKALTALTLEGEKQEIKRFEVCGITLEQKASQNEIADILWPGAVILANFVVELSKLSSEESLEEQIVLSDKGVHRKYKKEELLHHLRNLRSLLSHTKDSPVLILELGAGIGYSTIKIATELHTYGVVTDLAEALPSLLQNVKVNEKKFKLGIDSVSVCALDWRRVKEEGVVSKATKFLFDCNGVQNILLLAADCVYFPELHKPFEETIFCILSSSPSGSMCLIASERRWKSDNAFVANFGKYTRTNTSNLRIFNVKELVEFKLNDQGERQRTLSRIFIVVLEKK